MFQFPRPADKIGVKNSSNVSYKRNKLTEFGPKNVAILERTGKKRSTTYHLTERAAELLSAYRTLEGYEPTDKPEPKPEMNEVSRELESGKEAGNGVLDETKKALERHDGAAYTGGEAVDDSYTLNLGQRVDPSQIVRSSTEVTQRDRRKFQEFIRDREIVLYKEISAETGITSGSVNHLVEELVENGSAIPYERGMELT